MSQMQDRTGMSDEDFEALRRNLPRFREQAGEIMGLGRPLTQAELADLAGQKLDTLRTWEGGAKRPGSGPLLALARALGLAVDQIVAQETPTLDASRVRRFSVRFKMIGTPPPGFEADLQRFLETHTAEKAIRQHEIKKSWKKPPLPPPAPRKKP